MFSRSWRVLGGIVLYLILSVGVTARADDMGELRICLTELRQVEARFLSRVPSFLLTLDGNLVQIARGVQFIDQNSRTLEHNLEANPKDPNFSLLSANAVVGCRGYLDLFASRLRFYLFFIGCLLFTAVVLTLTLCFTMVPVNPSGGPRRATKISDDPNVRQPTDRRH